MVNWTRVKMYVSAILSLNLFVGCLMNGFNIFAILIGAILLWYSHQCYKRLQEEKENAPPS